MAPEVAQLRLVDEVDADLLGERGLEHRRVAADGLPHSFVVQREGELQRQGEPLVLAFSLGS